MQCHDARPLLPLHAYGDLSVAETEALEQHLAQCPSCRSELAAFRKLRQELSSLPAPAGAVDLPGIYQDRLARARRRSRFWQLAGGLAVVACALLLLMHLEVRVNAQQLVVRWGQPEPVIQERVIPQVVQAGPSSPEPSQEVLERLRLMDELIHALADSVEVNDQKRSGDLLQLQRELAALQRRTELQFVETHQDVDALYTAQFGGRGDGSKP